MYLNVVALLPSRVLGLNVSLGMHLRCVTSRNSTKTLQHASYHKSLYHIQDENCLRVYRSRGALSAT